MLRSVASRAIRNTTKLLRPAVAVQNVRASHNKSEDEISEKYLNYFNRLDIDGWEIRKAMNDLSGMDFVPEPEIICAALRACRRVNDYALAVRYIESVKEKCGSHVDKIYPYVLQEIRPTLNELGISTPEEMGYDKPEFALESVYDMH